MRSLWCGANRFDHLEVTRFGAVLARIFGYKRMANNCGRSAERASINLQNTPHLVEISHLVALRAFAFINSLKS